MSPDTLEQRIREVVERKLDFEVCYCQAVRSMKQEDSEGRLVEVDARRIVEFVARGLTTDITRALEAGLFMGMCEGCYHGDGHRHLNEARDAFIAAFSEEPDA